MAFQRRPSSSRSPRSRYTLGLLLLTAVTLLALDLPAIRPLRPVRGALATAFSPVRAAGNFVFRPIGNGWKGAFGYGDLEDQNDKLKARLDERTSDGAELARLRTENAELRKQLGVKAEGVRTKFAEVISGPVSNFDQTVQIDLGSDDGVKRGMAVITGLSEGTGGGLYGRVTQVQSGRSTVTLLTAPSFQVGALVENASSVLEGRGPGRTLVVDGIDPATKIKKGDWVYTSRVDESQFPKDLKIGRVANVRTSASGLSQTLEVKPMADLSGTYVKVVMKDAPR